MNSWEDFWADARGADLLEIAQRVGAKLKRVGADWIGPCPIGCAKIDGFVVTPAKGIFRCRPSSASGDVIKMVAHVKGYSAIEAGEWIIGRGRPDRSRDESRKDLEARLAMNAHRHEEEQRREEEQQRIEEAKREHDDEATDATLERAQDLNGPRAAYGKAYLQRRGLTPHPRLTGDIRFVPDLDYWGARENGSGEIVRLATLPAIVAIIRDVDGNKIGLNQVWLDPVEPRKWKPIGSPTNSARKIKGEKQHGMIFLGRPGERLAIGEGWETCLAWDQLRGMGFFGDTLAGEDITIAAAVDLGNLSGRAIGLVPHPTLKGANGKLRQIPNGLPDPNAPGWAVPEGVTEVWLLGDYDSEVFATAARMAVATRRVMDKGIKVHVAFPPTPGLDWNDQLLKGEGGAPEEPEPLPTNASYVEKVAAFRHPTHMETGPEYLERVAFLFDPPPPPTVGKFKLVPFEEINFSAAQEWLVKRLVPRQGVAPIFGASMGFKSFVAMDLGFHVALGWNWAGRRTTQGPVIYIAAENSPGVRKRKVGFEMVHTDNLPDRVPFYLIETAPNLGTDKNDREALIASIKAVGVAPALIIVDTLAQTLGGGEENNTGMVTFVGNATALANDFKCCVSPVHHTPLADDKRLRGHSSLLAGVDGLLRAERKATELVTVLSLDKLRDEEAGIGLTVHLVRFVIGRDEDGDEISTLIVSRIEEGGVAVSARAPKDKPSRVIPGQRRLLMDMVDLALDEAGQDILSFGDGPVVRAAPEDAVRRRFYIRIAEQADPNEKLAKIEERRRKAFNRNVEAALKAKELMAKGIDGMRFLWLP